MLASSRMTGLVEYFAAPFFARPRAGMPPKNNLAETARIYPRSNHICHKEIYKKARYSAARGLAALPCKHIQGQNILQQACCNLCPGRRGRRPLPTVESATLICRMRYNMVSAWSVDHALQPISTFPPYQKTRTASGLSSAVRVLLTPNS